MTQATVLLYQHGLPATPLCTCTIDMQWSWSRLIGNSGSQTIRSQWTNNTREAWLLSFFCYLNHKSCTIFSDQIKHLDLSHEHFKQWHISDIPLYGREHFVGLFSCTSTGNVVICISHVLSPQVSFFLITCSSLSLVPRPRPAFCRVSTQIRKMVKIFRTNQLCFAYFSTDYTLNARCIWQLPSAS